MNLKWVRLLACASLASSCGGGNGGDDDDDDIVSGDGDADSDADSGTDAGSDAGADAGSDPYECDELVSPQGALSGIDACYPGKPDYFDYYRREASSCATDVSEDLLCDPEDCDACDDGDLCVHDQVIWDNCHCITPCGSDAECGDGFACLCAGALEGSHQDYYSRCIEAECLNDADCGPGRCAVAVGGCHELQRLACRDEKDGCSSHSDCKSTDYGCFHNSRSGSWSCDLWITCD